MSNKNVHGSINPNNNKKYKVLHEESRKTIENRINNLYEKGWVLVGEVKYGAAPAGEYGMSERFVATVKNTKV